MSKAKGGKTKEGSRRKVRKMKRITRTGKRGDRPKATQKKMSGLLSSMS